jgi:hypothetical protein
MAWSFRRRIKIIPGVHMNLSKKGISTSIGVKGASLTLGQNGAYINTSIPGTGLYNRKKLSKGRTPIEDLSTINQPKIDEQNNIFSAEIHSITSQDMIGIKEAIIIAHNQRKELIKDLKKIKISKLLSQILQIISYFLIIGFVVQSIKKNIEDQISSKIEAITQIEDEIEKSYIDLDIEFEDSIYDRFRKLVTAFNLLAKSNKKWDVVNSKSENVRVTRSAASTIVKRNEIIISNKGIEDLRTSFEVLYFQNSNGADIFFYPAFIIMFESLTKLAIIGYDELNFIPSPVQYLERSTIPSDSVIIGKTWSKVNKDGTPDKRFKDNFEIPIVRYGQLNLRTDSGVNEEYLFSNYEFFNEFASAFIDYQESLKKLNRLPGTYFN